MSLNVSCPNCQTRYKLPDKFKGKKLKCKSCNKPFAATESTAKANAKPVNQTAKTSAAKVGTEDLANMGIGEIRRQAEPFAAPVNRGPDPLRNHVVQDPGFSMPSAAKDAAVVGHGEDDDDGIDSEFQAVTSNPYIKTQPSSISKSPNAKKTKPQKNASFGQRFLGNIIDGIFINIIAGAGGAAVGLLAESIPVLAVIIAVVAVVFVLSYYFVFEGITGRTVGKYMTGTKVVSEDGSKASFLQIIGRTFCRLIPLEIFSFLFYEDKSRPVFWHDALAGTRVVEN